MAISGTRKADHESRIVGEKDERRQEADHEKIV